MKRHLFFSLAMLGCILIGTACKNKTAGVPAAVPPDFIAFYERFLNDSLFQIEHVQFPLEGIPDNADSADVADGNFRWERESWKMHRKFDPKQTGFNVKLQTFGSDIITEQILHESGRYAMLRRYAKMDGDWRLIYYAGLNPLAEAEE